MLISIIVPAYNNEDHIKVCIESLLAQTYKEIEIIIVDDGSTDETYSVCQKYAENDPRIVLVRQENKGAGEARNTGIDLAQGDYYVFIDCDDYLIPEAVDILYNSLKKTDFRIQLANAEYTDFFEEGVPEVIHADTWKETIVSKEEAFRELVKDRPLSWVSINWKIFASGLFDDVRFPEGVRLYEDTYTAHLLMGKCDEMIKIDHPIYYYRHHPKSTMIQQGMRQYRPLYRAYMDRALWLRDHHMNQIYDLQRQFIEDRLRVDYAYCVENDKKEDMKTLCAIHREYYKENFSSLSFEQKVKRMVKCLIGRV